MSLIFFMVKVYEVKCSELLSGLLTQSSGQTVFGHPEEAPCGPCTLSSTSGPLDRLVTMQNPLIAIYFEDG